MEQLYSLHQRRSNVYTAVHTKPLSFEMQKYKKDRIPDKDQIVSFCCIYSRFLKTSLDICVIEFDERERKSELHGFAKLRVGHGALVIIDPSLSLCPPHVFE